MIRGIDSIYSLKNALFKIAYEDFWQLVILGQLRPTIWKAASLWRIPWRLFTWPAMLCRLSTLLMWTERCRHCSAACGLPRAFGDMVWSWQAFSMPPCCEHPIFIHSNLKDVSDFWCSSHRFILLTWGVGMQRETNGVIGIRALELRQFDFECVTASGKKTLRLFTHGTATGFLDAVVQLVHWPICSFNRSAAHLVGF